MMLWAGVMILYDKILWADDMLFIMSRWYMMPYYDYGWWCIVYPGICGRLCIHTLWHEESDLRTSFDLPTSGSASQSLSLRGTKDQNSSILGSKLCVDLGFRGDFRPRGHKFWASCHLPKALGLQKLYLRNVCRRSNIEDEIAVGQWLVRGI